MSFSTIPVLRSSWYLWYVKRRSVFILDIDRCRTFCFTLVDQAFSAFNQWMEWISRARSTQLCMLLILTVPSCIFVVCYEDRSTQVFLFSEYDTHTRRTQDMCNHSWMRDKHRVENKRETEKKIHNDELDKQERERERKTEDDRENVYLTITQLTCWWYTSQTSVDKRKRDVERHTPEEEKKNLTRENNVCAFTDDSTMGIGLLLRCFVTLFVIFITDIFRLVVISASTHVTAA
jgi:hypothetical protein